jgi:hypothetical protein
MGMEISLFLEDVSFIASSRIVIIQWGRAGESSAEYSANHTLGIQSLRGT